MSIIPSTQSWVARERVLTTRMQGGRERESKKTIGAKLAHCVRAGQAAEARRARSGARRPHATTGFELRREPRPCPAQLSVHKGPKLLLADLWSGSPKAKQEIRRFSCLHHLHLHGLCSLTAQMVYSHICEESVHFTVHSTKS